MRTSTTFNINAEEAQLPLILNGKYFKIVKAISDTKHQKAANGVVAACQVCPNNKSLRGSLKVTSNFLNHLKERHRPQYDEFLLEKDQQAKRARKEKSVEETPVRVELSHYINDLDESVESLNRYPTIKSAFFLYNTPLPSSAPVERLFSYAGMIGTGYLTVEQTRL
ncbi:hypothetical protein ACLKA6_008451 [Drosophila palustris]